MWKEILQLFKRDSLCEQAFDEAIIMLEESNRMFDAAILSLRQEGPLQVDVYKRDKQINKYERSVRRKILSHLAVSNNPDANTALVLTAVVIDIERIGDYTKNIVELAADSENAFSAGEIDEDFVDIEKKLAAMFDNIIPALGESDIEKAREIYTDHEVLNEIIEQSLSQLSGGEVLAGDSGAAVRAALYLRYLKRISAHLKNVATSVVNPYYRIGFREKPRP
jgi:phosphate uptake regulator